MKTKSDVERARHRPSLAHNRRGFVIAPVILIIIIVGVVVGLPLFVGGMGVTIKLLQLINTPVLAGYIPIWAILMGLLFLWFIFRR